MAIQPISHLARAGASLVGCGALLAGVVAAGVVPAEASTLRCGTSLTASVTLSANLNCTTDAGGPALIVSAGGVTVNLNGHSILGPGASAGTEGIVDVPGTTGAPHDGITIENGTISDFNDDIDLEGSSGSDLTGAVVENLKTTNNAIEQGYALYGDYLSGASVHNLSISDAYSGIELGNSKSSTISHNQLADPFYGLFDYLGTGNTWSDNSLSNINYYGIELEGATGAVVQSNTATGLGAEAIVDSDSNHATITDNSLSNLYDGIFDDNGSNGKVSGNIGSSDAYGVYANGTAGYTYLSNQFTQGQYGIETDYAVGELLKDNITDENSEAGVFVYTDNDTTHSYTATLYDNTANDNHSGLYSQSVTSGGGNHATGNTVTNCHDVTCVTGSSAGAGTGPPPPPATSPPPPPASGTLPPPAG